MASRSILIVGAVVLAGAVGAGGMYFAMSGDHGMMDHHGGWIMQNDETNMPGLQGENATPEESADLAVLFNNFDTITRKVENLPNGIRTVTRSSDADVMDALVNHSVGMIDRVGQLDDPKILIQSPTLYIFFLQGEDIVSEVSIEDEGLIVVQTSENPQIVEALQVHAAEVSAMADRGMQAVHEMMMANGESH
ncbi:hypothetical protein N8Z63_00035 [Octadecabacter sp.]|nr:hypothetical protein [Octadecabacter sp.]